MHNFREESSIHSPTNGGSGENLDGERVLKRENIQIDRKLLVCTLKENHRGKFLRISEESGRHRNTIIIPATGIEALQRALKAFVT